MPKYTPMIEQYLAVKEQVPDAFLFFRLGDFYELFFDDALNASRELEITLTGRDGGAEERIPMCGVPYHSAEGYIARLIQKGYKVAVCEQVEDPSEAKGVVRREIVRIVTPGTVMEEKHVGERSNNFLVTLAETASGIGVAACDLTTGELYATTIEHSLQSALDEANVYLPSELLVTAGMGEAVRKETAAWPRQVLVTERAVPGEADVAELNGHFAAGALTDVPRAEQTAVAVLIGYLVETQKRSLAHITAIKSYRPRQYMTLDAFTRRNLELAETVRDRARKGSLLWLLDRTATAMGGRMLRRWIDKPLLDKQEIEARLEAVEALHHSLIVREELRVRLKQVYDLERLIGRVCFGNANARDLHNLRQSLKQVPELLALCAESGSRTLRELVRGIDPCDDVLERIERAIVDEPPLSVKDGGMIRPGYHAYLDQLREASAGGKQWIAELERSEREATGVKSLKVGFNKVFGYYIEVTKANLAALPEGRYERKQTLANAERFVTPELKEKESLILEAEEKLTGLEYELFAELREAIAAERVRLQKLAEVVAAADVYQSLAEVSVQHRFVKPHMTDGFDLRIEEGRHPVIEAVMQEQSFIHNDTGLSKDRRIMLITGPNMAGKSTYMRQVALISVMAQIGSFVPAKSAQLPIIDRIFTRIGAADDLIGGQSTFMVEMKDIQIMMEKATERSLVIIDELGRGTSTGEGMAIAQAVIEHLHHRIGCKTLVSTHFHELAHLDESLAHLNNYRMAVKESGDDVTFLRKLVEGAASTSYGIYCARIAGIPEPIIERAYTLLHQFETRASALPGFAQEAAAAAEPQQPTLQLSLFELEQPAAKPEVRAALPPNAEQVLRDIRELDLMNLTPLAAMNVLYEMKQKLQKS